MAKKTDKPTALPTIPETKPYTKRAPDVSECITELPDNYQARYQMAKLREIEENVDRLRLDNVKKNLELTKSQGNLCYIRIAEDTFNLALNAVASVIKTAAERVAGEIGANPDQSVALQVFFDELLDELSTIEIHIPTTAQTDASLEHTGRAAKEQARGA